MIGKTPKDLRFRSSYGMSLLAIHRGEETMSHVQTADHEAVALGEVPLLAGDTLVVHTPWDMLSHLKRNNDFVVVTSDFPEEEETRPRKMGWALQFLPARAVAGAVHRSAPVAGAAGRARPA